MENDKPLLYMVAIVAIVAIFGIVFMILGGRGNSDAISLGSDIAVPGEGSDLVGEATLEGWAKCMTYCGGNAKKGSALYNWCSQDCGVYGDAVAGTGT